MKGLGRLKNAVFFLLIGIVGIAVGWAVNVALHEVAHYSVATLFDQKSIQSFNLPPDQLLNLVTTGNAKTGTFSVVFRESFPYGLAFWQATLINLAGVGIQLVFAFVIAGFVRNILDKQKRTHDLIKEKVSLRILLIAAVAGLGLVSTLGSFIFFIMMTTYVLYKQSAFFELDRTKEALILGVYASVLGMISSWWVDGIIILNGLHVQYDISAGIATAFSFVFAYLILRFIGFRVNLMQSQPNSMKLKRRG